MGSKAELLRAMREAQVKDKSSGRGVMLTSKSHPETHDGGDSVPLDISSDSLETVWIPKPKRSKGHGLKLRSPSKRKIVASGKPKTNKVNDGKRFVPNKTKGRPHGGKAHLTNEARKPWEAMKISRRTWYRRMAKEIAK